MTSPTTRRTVWQIGTSGGHGDVLRLFAETGAAYMGSAIEAAWNDAEHTADHGYLKPFAEAVRQGDLCLARAGTSRVAMVGVFGTYHYCNGMRPVRGWPMRHARLVRWLPVEPFDIASRSFTRQRFTKCPKAASRAELERRLDGFDLTPPIDFLQFPPQRAAHVPLERLDRPVRAVVSAARTLHGAWANGHLGRGNASKPSEHEGIAHVTVPLLRALGWCDEQVAVEWNRVDVAVFAELPRTPGNCRLIVEQKRLDTELLSAEGQAERYRARHGLTDKVPLVVSDGHAIEVHLPNGERLDDLITDPSQDLLPILEHLRNPDA